MKSLNPQSSILNPIKGQLLIESMIGISIVIVGLLGILALLSRSISANRIVGGQFIGNYLAAEGIEITKNIIDADWMKGGAWNDDYLQYGDFEIDYQTQTFQSGAFPSSARTFNNNPLYFDNNLYNYNGSGKQTNFTRKITLKLSSDGNKIQVNSIVKWTTRGGGEFNVNLEDHFFDWRP